MLHHHTYVLHNHSLRVVLSPFVDTIYPQDKYVMYIYDIWCMNMYDIWNMTYDVWYMTYVLYPHSLNLHWCNFLPCFVTQEVLLPFLSVLRVQDVSFEAGQATRVRCQFQGVSDRIWADADIFLGTLVSWTSMGWNGWRCWNQVGFTFPNNMDIHGSK